MFAEHELDKINLQFTDQRYNFSTFFFCCLLIRLNRLLEPFHTSSSLNMNTSKARANVISDLFRIFHRLSYQGYKYTALYEVLKLLQNNKGHHLFPCIKKYREYSELIALRGTIPIVYQGASCDLPVNIILPPTFPEQPPICRVQPTKTMVINTNNPCVGSKGEVYMPYLKQWQYCSHNLVGSMFAMQDIFGIVYPLHRKFQLLPQKYASRPSKIFNFPPKFASLLETDSGKLMSCKNRSRISIFNDQDIICFSKETSKPSKTSQD